MDMVFEKKVLSVNDEAMNFEWMDRNQTGAYSSSTISGMNTRREHGLFVTPSADHTKKVVLLSKLEESVFVDNRLHEISTNRFPNNIFPNGYQYLKKFSLNPFPKSIFHVEDRVIHRTLFWVANRNILVMRFELKNQGSPIKLIIKPFLTARYNLALTDEIQGMNTDSYLSHHSVRWAPRAFLPQLHAYFLSGSYSTATLWYHNFYYEKDLNRFQDQQEDLLNPGFFEVKINPYESFDIFFSTEDLAVEELDYEAYHRAELNRRGLGIAITTKEEDPASNFRNHLRLSRYAFNGKIYPALSSINPTKKLREILFSMPGLYLAEEKYDEFKEHFKNMLSLLDGGLLPTQYPVVTDTISYAAADLSLWLIDLAYKYYSESNDIAFFEDGVFEALQSIIDAYVKGTGFNIYNDADDLIFTGDKNSNVSWQYGSKVPGTQFRYGKLLEINALWYNALCVMIEFSKKLDKNRYTGKYHKLSDKVKRSFNKIFVNNETSFFDWVREDSKSDEFTINQLIPLSLNFRCCEDEHAIKVLKRIESDLLTPFGLRILSKDTSKQKSKEYERHLIKPSLTSMYFQACMHYRPVSHETIQNFQPLIGLAKKGLLGFIPEYITTNKEQNQVGILDYTPALADWIWLEYIFSKQ